MRCDTENLYLLVSVTLNVYCINFNIGKFEVYHRCPSQQVRAGVNYVYTNAPTKLEHYNPIQPLFHDFAEYKYCKFEAYPIRLPKLTQ